MCAKPRVPNGPGTRIQYVSKVFGGFLVWSLLPSSGVPPTSASLKGFNLISSNQTLANYVSSLGGASYSNDVDIFNQSYGSDRYYSTTINSTIEAQYIYGVSSLRSGKGAIYIKSSGISRNLQQYYPTHILYTVYI